MTPIYGHVSEETAYLVDDYPYGYSLRCKIRYWLEHSGNKGWRMVSQTQNPKNGRWNAPKKSTYCNIGACMFLDENNHVKWQGVGVYSSKADLEKFADMFPQADLRLVNAAIEYKRLRGGG